MALYKLTDQVLIRNVTIPTNVLPGDVLISGKRPEISSVRAFAGEEAVGLEYWGGEYTGTADGPMSAGDSVYYAPVTGKVTKTRTGAYHLGYCTAAPEDCSDGSTVRILHAPNGTQLGDSGGSEGSGGGGGSEGGSGSEGNGLTPAAPITLTQEALTDETGGTAAGTLLAPTNSSTYTVSDLAANFATLAAQLENARTDIRAIRDALQTAGVIRDA